MKYLSSTRTLYRRSGFRANPLMLQLPHAPFHVIWKTQRDSLSLPGMLEHRLGNHKLSEVRLAGICQSKESRSSPAFLSIKSRLLIGTYCMQAGGQKPK